MKEFQCKDVFPDCNYSTLGESDTEVLAQAVLHAQERHGIQQVDDELFITFRSMIHDKKEAA